MPLTKSEIKKLTEERDALYASVEQEVLRLNQINNLLVAEEDTAPLHPPNNSGGSGNADWLEDVLCIISEFL